MYNDEPLPNDEQITTLAKEYMSKRLPVKTLSTKATTMSQSELSEIAYRIEYAINSTYRQELKSKLKNILDAFKSTFDYTPATYPNLRTNINRQLLYIVRLLLSAAQKETDPTKAATLISYANDIAGLFDIRIF